MDPRRSERVSEAIREEIEEVSADELSDPRIQVNGVVEVLISPDARTARIRLILAGEPSEQKECIEALNRAKGYIKRELAQRLDIFRMPELQFEAALPAEMGGRVLSLLKRVKRGRPRAEPNES